MKKSVPSAMIVLLLLGTAVLLYGLVLITREIRRSRHSPARWNRDRPSPVTSAFRSAAIPALV